MGKNVIKIGVRGPLQCLGKTYFIANLAVVNIFETRKVIITIMKELLFKKVDQQKIS